MTSRKPATKLSKFSGWVSDQMCTMLVHFLNFGGVKMVVLGFRLRGHPYPQKILRDRELRELRMKQINAAWEIISGRRPS